MLVKDIINGADPIWLAPENKKKPMVSVLLPTFRRAKNGFFERAVHSVLNQTFRHFELIVEDDCSSDGTFDIIKAFMAQDDRIGCIRHQKNIGLPAISGYEGFCYSRGDYIAFIFDDNEWDSMFLQKTISYMQRENLLASYGVVRSHGEDGSFVDSGLPTAPISMTDLRWTNFIGNGGVVLHRSIVESIGWYDPHIVMTRLCDWDYWLRISRSFRFEATGIFAGHEWGCTQADSLGNSLKMEQWATWEKAIQNRKDLLLPENYGNYDVEGIHPHATSLFVEMVESLRKQYKEKFWFQQDILHCTGGDKKPLLRVLVVCPFVDATFSLGFDRLIDGNQEIMYKMIPLHAVTYSEFAYVDAVIVLRNLFSTSKILGACKFYKIPCWFFLDDNFAELSKENKYDPVLKDLAKHINYQYLSQFTGIIVSTPELKNYFKTENLHDRVEVLPPSSKFAMLQKEKEDEVFTFGFMGGTFRVSVLEQIVIPALLRLGKKKNIRLVVPEGRISKIIKKSLTNLELIEIPVSNSLEATLFRYAAYQIDVLIHCGNENSNNIFKTENSLINAVELDAVLVTSNIEPYNNSLCSGEGFLTVDNEIDNWFDVLEMLAEQAWRREELKKNARKYCIDRYYADNCQKKLNKLFLSLTPVRLGETMMRLKHLYEDTIYHMDSFMKEIEDSDGGRPKRSNALPLQLSKLIEKSTAYDIICPVENWDELGIGFASYSECAGSMVVQIYDGKNLVREIRFDMAKFTRDDWTYLGFDPIPNSKDKRYTIKFYPTYEQFSSRIGVFEITERRTLIYKCFEKLHLHLRGTDILFADCRS